MMMLLIASCWSSSSRHSGLLLCVRGVASSCCRKGLGSENVEVVEEGTLAFAVKDFFAVVEEDGAELLWRFSGVVVGAVPVTR